MGEETCKGRNQQGLKLMSYGHGGKRDLGQLPGWETGGSAFVTIQENRRGSRFGTDGGESRYNTRCLQTEILPRPSRPARGGGRQVHPHSASPGCKDHVRTSLPGAKQKPGDSRTAGEPLTALNRSKLLWLICKFMQVYMRRAGLHWGPPQSTF